ncbi:MAG: TIGR01777 family oxidoreductase [Ilumatobacteraceae bacterium]
MRVAVTGSHGLIGTALLARLRADGHVGVPVVRSTAKHDEIGWDPAAGRLDPRELSGVDAVVNLAGAGIGDHRWTDDYKREVMESRTKGTALLARTLADLADGPRVLLSGSAVGYYGDRGDEELDERSAPGTGFLTEVVEAWEAATAPAEAAGVRVAHLRTGIVLAPKGGVLAKLLPLFKLGVGGRFGSGKQWMSWISLDDEVSAILHLLASDVTGPVNLTAPNPVTNAELADTLGDVLHRPTILPVPAFAPRLLLGGDRADGLLFDGPRVLPRVLQGDGFPFAHPTLADCLHAVLRR